MNANISKPFPFKVREGLRVLSTSDFCRSMLSGTGNGTVSGIGIGGYTIGCADAAVKVEVLQIRGGVFQHELRVIIENPSGVFTPNAADFLFDVQLRDTDFVVNTTSDNSYLSVHGIGASVAEFNTSSVQDGTGTNISSNCSQAECANNEENE